MALGGVVGSLRVNLGANTAQYEQKMRQAQRTAQTTAKRIEGSLKTAFSPLTDIRTLAITAGVASLAAFGRAAVDVALKFRRVDQALKIATGSTQKAAQEFDFIRDLADRLGLRFITLAEGYIGLAAAAKGTNLEGEETRRIFEAVTKAVVATGGSMEQAQGALLAIQQIISKGTVSAEELRGQLGERLPGAFQIAARAVGLTTGELGKMLEQGAIASEDFLPRFADQLGKELPNSVQTADAAFQRFQTALDDVANSSADGFMKELGDATDDLTDVLKDLQSSGALEAFGAFLGDIITLGGQAVGVLVELIAQSRELGQLGNLLLSNPILSAAGAGNIVGRKIVGDTSGEVGIGELGTSVTGNLGALVSAPRTRPPITFKPKAKKGRKGPSAETLAARAERERQRALREAADAARALRDAAIAELEAKVDLAGDEVERGNLKKQILDLEGEQRVADLNLAVGLKDLDAKTAEALKLSDERVRALQGQALAEEVRQEGLDQGLRLDTLTLDQQRELLELRGQMATTAAERRDIELRLLALDTEQERLEIERLKLSKEWIDQEEARRREVVLGRRTAAQTAAILDRTQGPLEGFLSGIPNTAAEANEALQLVAVDGLRALEDGILSVIDGTKSLGEAFRDMASLIIAELLRIQIQRMLIAPLGNALSGLIGGGGTIASLAGDSAALIASNPGIFASGGFTGMMPTNKIAGFVHGREFVFDAPAVARIGVGNLEAIRQGLRPGNDNTRSGKNGSIFNINVTAPNTGDPKRDRITAMQQASLIRTEVARASRNGF